MSTEDELYTEILDKNLYSMLYCLRSKDVCVEIARMFLKSDQVFENFKLKVLKIDRISKDQTKKPIFVELYPNTTD